MKTSAALSFIDATIRVIYPQDFACRELAESCCKRLVPSRWALGDLKELAIDLAGMTRTLQPPAARKQMVVMVGDHGVAAEGNSRRPDDTTTQRVHALVRGEAGVTLLARRSGIAVCVVDAGAKDDFTGLVQDGKIIAKKIGRGTSPMVNGPVMTRTHAVMAVEAGIEVANRLAAEVDIFGTMAIGIGSTMSSAAITAVCTGKKVEELLGQGGRVGDSRLQHKIGVVNEALAHNRPNAKDGLDVLAKVGGFEIGAIAGLIIGAAAKRKPVVVDGVSAAAGAMIACSIEPFVRDYILCAQRSADLGHGALIDRLQCRPLLGLDLRLGEGAAAVLALEVVEAAAALLAGMSTGTGVAEASSADARATT